MKKLYSIFAALAILPAFAHGELKQQSVPEKKCTWGQRTAATLTWGILFTCCPQTSRQILAHLLRK